MLGAHEAAAKCVEWLPGRGLLATGSWDRWAERAGQEGREGGAVLCGGQVLPPCRRHGLHCACRCRCHSLLPRPQQGMELTLEVGGAPTHAVHPPHLPRTPCSSLRLWDPRAAPGAAQVARVALPGKAYSMSASGERLVVGCSGRHVDIYDLRT